MKFKLLSILSIVLLTSAFFFVSSQTKSKTINTPVAVANSVDSVIKQNIKSVTSEPVEVYQVYYNNQRVGVLKDMRKLDDMLKRVYEERFKDSFPNSSIQLSDEVIISKEMVYYDFEDVDDQILAYLNEKDLYYFEAYKITFSNGNVLYVEDLDAFYTAKEQYMLNFINYDEYESLKKPNYQVTIPEGVLDSKFTAYKIAETMKTPTKSYGPSDKILKTKEEIVTYLSYGYNPVPKTYTIKPGDTLQGIYFEFGITPQQIVTINPNIASEDQPLEPGTEINIAYFNSPINVLTEKDARITRDLFRGEAEYVYDDQMPSGKKDVLSEGNDGYAELLIHEYYENGILVDSKELDYRVVVEPKNAVIKIGTKIIPGEGTGTFRVPVDNAYISCAPGCYVWGGVPHAGTDYQDRYNRNGPIYAADTGRVVVNSYNGINGNWVEIDHGGGLSSYYGHMNSRSPIAVGTVVSKGEYIGDIGQTGVATGPHVHFEIRQWSGGKYGSGSYSSVQCNYLSCY